MVHLYVLFSFSITILSTLVAYERFLYAFLIFLCVAPIILFRFLFQIKNKSITIIIFASIGTLLCVYVQNNINLKNYEYNQGFIYDHKEKGEYIGVIDSYPSYRFSNNQYSVFIKDTKTRVLLYTQPYQKFKYLDEINFKTTFNDVREGDTLWKNQYKKMNIHYVVWYPDILQSSISKEKTFKEKLLYQIFELKIHIRNNIINLFSSHTSALVLGMLLGDKDELSKEEKDMFNNANLSHILVVSGYNIALVITFVFLILKPFNRYLKVIISILMIFLFVLIVGFDASVLRAALMGSLIVISKIIHRQSGGVHALFLVAMCMVLYDPYIIFDVGFHLSFIATYSLFILPSFKKIPEYAMTIFWVFCFVSPYTLYLSESISFGGIITNILVLFFVPIFMFIAFVSLVFSSMHIFVGIDIFILEIIGHYIFMAGNLALFIPRFQYHISPQIIVGIYMCILSFVTFIQNRFTTKEFIERHYQKFVPQRSS